MLNLPKQAAASNGNAAVLIGEFSGGPVLVRYVPRALGNWDRRDEFDALVNRAIAKLGWKRDRRTRIGYRRINVVR